MTELVEGDWNNFVFKLAEPSDTPRILEHMRKNFYRDEPLCKHVGYDDNMADDFDELIVQVLPHNLSFIALDKESNKVAGVRLTTIEKQTDNHSEPNFKSPKSVLIRNYLTKLTKNSKVCETHGVDQYADFMMTSVDSEFRGQGLVTEMYRRSIVLLTSKGFPVANSVFSSPFTRKAASKFGFRELARLHLKDYQDESGVFPYPNAEPDEFSSVMTLKLN